MQNITLLEAVGKERLLAKAYQISTEGELTIQSYSNAFKFKRRFAECGDLNSLFKILLRLQSLPSYCIIRGQTSAETPEIVSRKKELFPEPEEGCSWAMLDIDGVPPPPGVDPCSRDAVEYVTTLLPAEFREVSYVAALSNSAGIRKPDGELLKPGIRVHLFYLLNHPVQGPLLAAWLEQHCYNADFYTVGPNSGNIPMVNLGIDPAPLRSSVQIHYTAAPILGEGVDCDVPPEGRIWLQTKDADFVQVPEIEPTLPHEVKERKNEIRKNWAVENGYRLENRLVDTGHGRYSSERLVPENLSEIRMGRELIRADLRANGNVLGLVLADEKTPNSWYVVKSRPWLARRMGDEVEIPLEEFCPAALTEVQRLGWIIDIYEGTDNSDSGSAGSSDGFVPTQSEPPSGMVSANMDSFLNSLFRHRWGGSGFLYSRGYVQMAFGDPPNTQWITVFSFFYTYSRVRTEHNSGWSYVLHALCRDGSWNEIILPAQDLHDGNKAAMVLAGRGVEIYPKGNKLLGKYIQEYPCQRIRRLVERTGWSNDHSRFVLPERVFGTDPEGSQEEIYLSEQAKNLIRGVRSQGTFEQWQELVSPLCLGNSRLEMAVYQSFLPPLMKPLGLQTFGVHYWGTTSTGKSVTKQVAVSIWGDPTLTSHQWRATDNGLEGLAYAHNDILMALDELKQTTDPKMVQSAVFTLGNETGKVRADRDGGLRPVRHWRLTYVSTGEIGSAQFIRDGGETVMAGYTVRMLDIPADGGAGMGVIETLQGHPNSKEQVKALEYYTTQYFGTAAVAFLAALFASEYLSVLREHFLSFNCEFMERLPQRQRVPEQERILEKFAAIAFAGELAIEFGVLPYPSGQAIHTMVRMAVEYENARGGDEGWDILERIAWIRREISRGRYSNFKRLNRQRNVFRDGGFEPRTFWGYAIYPNAESDQIMEFRIPRALFKTTFCQNLNADLLISAMRERGYLDEDRHLIGARRERCYVLSYAFVAGGEDEIEGGEEGDEPRRTPLDEMREI